MFCYDKSFCDRWCSHEICKSETIIMYLEFRIGVGRNRKEVFRKVFDCRRLGIICSFKITLSPIFFFFYYFIFHANQVFLCRSLSIPPWSVRLCEVYYNVINIEKLATEYRIKNIVICSGKRMKLILLSSFYFDFVRIIFLLCNGVERIELDVIFEHRKKGTGNSDRYLTAHTSKIYILYIYLLLTFKQNWDQIFAVLLNARIFEVSP